MPAPTFLGVGVKKSGTTTIWDYLYNHPEVYTGQKEINWFVEPNGRSLAEYEAMFSDEYAVRGEFSPDYMFHLDAIHAVYPGMKLILAVRHPLEQFISHLRHIRQHSPADVCEYDVDYLLLRSWHGQLDCGRIEQCILHTMKLGFPLHVIDFDRLVSDQQTVWQELCAFLDVTPVQSDYIHAHPTIGERFPPLTTMQIDRLQQMFAPSVAFLKEHYGIDYTGAPDGI